MTYLCEAPLLILAFQSCEDNREDCARILEQICHDFDAPLAVNLLEDPLVDCLAVSSLSDGHTEIGAVFGYHTEKGLCDWLKQADNSSVCLDAKVVIVSLLLDSVEALLESVLAMSDES